MSVDPKLAEIRRAAAERYKRAPAEAKPHIRVCDDCHSPVYDSKVCSATGKLHAVVDGSPNIIGGTIVDSSKKTMTTKELTDAINEVRVKWQPSRVRKVEIDGDSIGIFQTFVMTRKWQLMRVGILYGRVTEESEGPVVTVDSIYEPEQNGSSMDFQLLEDRRQVRIDALAKRLGLKRVGLCCTHQPRDPNEIVVTAKELLHLAKEQSVYGDHCVLLTIGPSHDNQEISAQAWQASQQSVHLLQLGFLEESPEDIRFIRSKKPLEVAQEQDEKGHKKLIIKEPSTSVDARWMIAPVAVEQFHSTVVRNTFARISRPGEEAPGFQNMRAYLQHPKRKSLSFIEGIADFHVLVFLADNLFTEEDMDQLVKCVLEKNSKDAAIFEEILKGHMRELGFK
jgi:nuclear protein localization family protein 4